LPRLPKIELAMHDAGRELAPQTQRLKEIMLQVLADNLAAISSAKLASRKQIRRQPKSRIRRRQHKNAVRTK